MNLINKLFVPFNKLSLGWYRIIFSLWIFVTSINTITILFGVISYYFFGEDGLNDRILMAFGFFGYFIGVPFVFYLILRFVLWIYDGFNNK